MELRGKKFLQDPHGIGIIYLQITEPKCRPETQNIGEYVTAPLGVCGR